MEWLERMNRAMDYIEANLTEEIELSEAARMACCSSYQFQRMFSFITDVTLAEYIRRRRLTLSALELHRKTGPDTFPYMLFAFKVEASNMDGYTSVTIPAHTWAIFPSDPHPWDRFDETIETLYKRFYTEWLPTAGYEQVDGIEFEMYGAKDGLNYIELWFAVRKA